MIFAVPCLYVIARVLWPLPWPLLPKVAVAVLLLAASQYHRWSRLSSGSMFAPEFPRPIVLWFNWAFGTILLLAVMQIVFDLVSVGSLLLPGDGWAISSAWRYAAALAAMLLSALAVQQATRVPPLKDAEIAIANLPPAFDGYTILHLTDLHISRLFTAAWAQEVVARANALQVDVTAITGDLIDGALAARRADVEPLASLRAKDGVWVVPGNHEYFFDYQGWMRHYAEMGLNVLANRHALVRRGDDALVLAGVTDLSARRAGHAPHDLEGALAGVPPDAPIILLDHQPRNARTSAARGVALQLSGHTHGGMILGFDRLFASANAGFVSGRYAVGAMTLYVNNGTGLWPGFALRLGRPSELTRITLRRAGPVAPSRAGAERPDAASAKAPEPALVPEG